MTIELTFEEFEHSPVASAHHCHELAHHPSAPFYHFSIYYIKWQCDRRKPPPPGGSYLLCSLIKNPEEDDPPRSTWYNFFEGGPLPSGSWLGNLLNTKPPPGGGKCHDQVELTFEEFENSLVASAHHFHELAQHSRAPFNHFLIYYIKWQ